MKPKLRPINNQVVVLFGATSGIGLETAVLMAGKGAKVVIVGRSQEGLSQATERVREQARAAMQARRRGNGSRQIAYQQPSGMVNVEGGGAPVAEMEDQVMSIEADVTNWDQVKSVAEQVMQRHGRIDTWVNIAAVAHYSLFEDTNPDEFRRVVEVNLIGQAYGAMAVLPYMKQQRGGSLIFVSSVTGKVPVPYQSAYNASKHGLVGLAETLRMEMKHTNIPINVTTIIPSSVNTPLFDKARTKMGVEPDPIPPIYDTKLVARAIVHAAQRPVRELIVGDAGYMITFMRRLAPTLTSNAMGAYGFRAQRSNQPKSAQEPDNMFHHTEGHNQIEGEYSHRSMRFSPLTWLATHPKARMGLMTALLGGIGYMIGSRIVQKRRNRRRSFQYRARHFGKEAAAFLASLPLISSLPMFQRKSFVKKATDWMPSFGREKSIGDRIKSQRDRLPEHLPLEKGRHQVMDRLDKERQQVKDRLQKERKQVKDRFEKQRKEAKKRMEKERNEALKEVERKGAEISHRARMERELK